MSQRYFVTAIDTGIGKTVISAILAKSLNTAYFKPIQCGNIGSSDSKTVKRLAPEVVIYPERYCFKLPAAPLIAAAAEGKEIAISHLHRGFQGNSPCIVEGAGGVLVPIHSRYFMADLIRDLDLPAIIVAQNYLGSINHTLLTIEALMLRKIRVRGIIINGRACPASEEAITLSSGVSILAHVPKAPKLCPAFITDEAKRDWLDELR